jgi:limonene-1,2-epoxide hydrolase
MRISTLLFLVICGGIPACAKETTTADAERLAVADEMISAWNSMEWDRAFNLFADDGVLHSVMIEPIVGKAAIRERLLPLVNGLDRIELQVVNKGNVNDVVMFERVDDFVYKGKYSQIPVVGVMEISNGKIDVWREYYDKASLTAALSSPDAAGSVQSEILALTKKLSTDWNNGGMSDYLSAYSDEVEMSLLFQSRVIASKLELTDFFTSSWKTKEAMGQFETDQVGVRQIASGTAIARGLFKHRFPDELVRGAFTHVWQKTNAGTWKIIHEHTSRGHSEQE